MNDSLQPRRWLGGLIPQAGRLTRPAVPLVPTPAVVSIWSSSTHWAGGVANCFQHTRSHSLCTSFSASCLQFIKLSIHPSSVGIDAGSVAGDSRWGSGSFPISTSIFESILWYSGVFNIIEVVLSSFSYGQGYGGGWCCRVCDWGIVRIGSVGGTQGQRELLRAHRQLNCQGVLL